MEIHGEIRNNGQAGSDYRQMTAAGESNGRVFQRRIFQRRVFQKALGKQSNSK